MKKIFKILSASAIIAVGLCHSTSIAKNTSTNPLEMAERFAGGKLKTMLFSTRIKTLLFNSKPDKFLNH